MSFALTLKGGVDKVWTVDSAKKEAFKDAKQWVDLSPYPSIDPNYNKNKNSINKNQLISKERTITVFSKNGYLIAYGIEYENNITENYYYDFKGQLHTVDFTIFPKNIYTLEDSKKYPHESLFPAKVYKHIYPSGKLISVSLMVRETEDYIFEPNGELTAHCIGNNCYDANNNLIYTRESK
jgi:hypothetical protein